MISFEKKIVTVITEIKRDIFANKDTFIHPFIPGFVMMEKILRRQMCSVELICPRYFLPNLFGLVSYFSFSFNYRK